MKRKVLNAEAVRGMSIWDRLWWFVTGSLPEKCFIEVDDGVKKETSSFIPSAVVFPFELKDTQVREIASKFLFPEKKRNVLSREEFLKRIDLSPLGIEKLYPYQREAFLNSGEGSVFYRWGRRTGKDIILLLETLYRVYLGKKEVLFIGMNSQDGKRMQDKFNELLRRNPFVCKVEKETQVNSLSPFRNDLRGRGINPDLVVLNEFEYLLDKPVISDYHSKDVDFLLAGTILKCEARRFRLPVIPRNMFCSSDRIPNWEEISKDMMDELSPAEFKKEFLIGDI